MDLNLRDISIDVIKQNQHPSGAFIASPNFDNYKYSWLRDGSFIAYSMDVIGEHESARKFYQWVNKTINNHHGKYEQLIEKHDKGDNLEIKDFLPCRYTLEGYEVEDNWPSFQLDGYGTWLWGLSEHIRMTNSYELIDEFSESIKDTINYLLVFWNLPNSDCWEENVDKIHPATLACIHGGLTSINEFMQKDDISQTTTMIKDFLLENAIYEDRFVKYIGSTSVDASLLWLTVPFNVFSPENTYIKNTVKLIEERILHQGGVHRFPEDTYYGGGEWLLLSSWLGWYYLSVGKENEAKDILKWVENQAEPNGFLPEQVLHHVNEKAYIEKWLNLWGPVATPLLWSHAMYLILLTKLSK